MDTLEQLSDTLQRMTEGLESDLEKCREHTTAHRPPGGRFSIHQGEGLAARDNRLRRLELELEVAAGRVRWYRPALVMPTSDRTVLVYATDAGGPLWLGFHDRSVWRAEDGSLLEAVELWGEILPPDGIAGATDR
jgi:hypothetical protein